MRKITLIMLILAIVMSACSLSNDDDNGNQPDNPIQLPTQGPPEDSFPIETNEPAVAANPEPTEAAADQQPDPINSGGGGNISEPVEIVCQPRTDWAFSYQVIGGDTLTRIAQRANTTASTLADGNCIANPNALQVGQLLRTPNQVIIPTAIPQPTALGDPYYDPTDPEGRGYIDRMCVDGSRPETGDYVMVLPMLAFANGCVDLADRDTVTLTWPGVPAGTTEVVYLIRFPNTMNPHEVGRSTDAARQFPVTLPVANLGGNGMLTARVMVNGNPTAASEMLVYRTVPTFDTGCGDLTETLGGAGSPEITPALSVNNFCYRVAAGTTITVSMPVVPPEAVEVTFYRNNSRLSRADVIGVDRDLSDGASITYTVPATMPPSVIYPAPLPGDFGGIVGLIVE